MNSSKTGFSIQQQSPQNSVLAS